MSLRHREWPKRTGKSYRFAAIQAVFFKKNCCLKQLNYPRRSFLTFLTFLTFNVNQTEILTDVLLGRVASRPVIG